MSNGTISHGQVTTTTSGWVTFAGIMMIVAGFFQAIAGFVALFKPSLYVSAGSQMWILNFTQWGWAHLILGIVLVLSAFSLFAGQTWGRIVAITLATLSAIANFAFITVYPFWSIMIIAIDIFVIYAVATHGRLEEE